MTTDQAWKTFHMRLDLPDPEEFFQFSCLLHSNLDGLDYQKRLELLQTVEKIVERYEGYPHLRAVLRGLRQIVDANLYSEDDLYCHSMNELELGSIFGFSMRSAKACRLPRIDESPYETPFEASEEPEPPIDAYQFSCEDITENDDTSSEDDVSPPVIVPAVKAAKKQEVMLMCLAPELPYTPFIHSLDTTTTTTSSSTTKKKRPIFSRIARRVSNVARHLSFRRSPESSRRNPNADVSQTLS